MSGSFIEREMVLEALSKMQEFHHDLDHVMTKHNLNLTQNLGRRNILLSQAQEAYFAKALAKKYDVTSSGRTGEPDIVVRCLDKELECKLASKQKSGAIGFQSDYETLLQKGSLDYLYVIASENFDEFAVFHYEGLTVDDFGPMANGSRGKVQLIKHKAYDKLHSLAGKMINLNKENLINLSKKREQAKTEKQLEKIDKSISYWSSCPIKFKIELEGINGR
jgi:hypothetical protein